MQISVTFNFTALRAQKPSFYLTDKYKDTWTDTNNPTDAEMEQAIKADILEKMKDDDRLSSFEITD